MSPLVDFLANLGANLAGVFAGVVLALWTDRKREERQDAREQATLEKDLAHARHLVLSSVVKNTSEAKTLVRVLETGDDPYLFQVGFELAVWKATQTQFMQIAVVDERVLLSRFFDQIGRLVRLMDFNRELRVQVELRQGSLDEGDRALLEQSCDLLRVVAEDVRIDGLVIVTDLGEPVHKRLLGIHEPT